MLDALAIVPPVGRPKGVTVYWTCAKTVGEITRSGSSQNERSNGTPFVGGSKYYPSIGKESGVVPIMPAIKILGDTLIRYVAAV